jgi:hypothetical protein
MANSSVRALMLQSKLQSLKSKNSGMQLYQEKHTMLPLESRARLQGSYDDEQLLTSSTPSKGLVFAPLVKSVTGSIRQNAVLAVVAFVMVGVGWGVSSIVNKSLTGQSASTSSSSVTVTKAQAASASTEFEDAYKKIASERSYGEVLFEKMSLSGQLTIQTDTQDIALGAGSSFGHAEFSVVPGVKGHSLFISKDASSKTVLDTIVPGTRITVAVGDVKKPTSKYQFVFIASNEYTKDDSALLTSTQKSILNLVLPTAENKVQSYQFRLIGVDK